MILEEIGFGFGEEPMDDGDFMGGQIEQRHQ